MFGMFRRPPPSLGAGERAYAIGDVHGRHDLLAPLLEMLRSDNASRPKADTTLIILGDLIDRGPDSRKVVECARQGVDWARNISLMGNHEAIMLDVLDGDTELLARWLRFGGEETLLSWGVAPSIVQQGTRAEIIEAFNHAITRDERTWLSRLRKHYRMGDYYFVHAGVRPGIALYNQSDEDRLWIRDEFLESSKMHEAIIVHGHSINPEVEERENRIGLDTGAYSTGRLTAIGIEGRERWFIDTIDGQASAKN